MANAVPIPGKICLVTGATSGIGYETALGLARAGARVGIVGRDAGRTDEAASRIRDAVPGAVGTPKSERGLPEPDPTETD